MQERRSEHYSEQRGHWERGEADRFRRIFGFKPVTLQAEIIRLPQIEQDRRRSMRRITRDGR